MTTLTINIPADLKSEIQKKAKKEWVTLTFLTQQFYNAYLEWKAKFWLITEEVRDEIEYRKTLKKLSEALKKVDFSKIPSLEEQLKDI